MIKFLCMVVRYILIILKWSSFGWCFGQQLGVNFRKKSIIGIIRRLGSTYNIITWSRFQMFTQTEVVPGYELGYQILGHVRKMVGKITYFGPKQSNDLKKLSVTHTFPDQIFGNVPQGNIIGIIRP